MREVKNCFFFLLAMLCLVSLASAGCGCSVKDVCTDGTPYGTCSANKPKFCSTNGILMDDVAKCGCPEGLVADVAKMNCVSEEEGELFFIVGSPFSAYDANPLAYVKEGIGGGESGVGTGEEKAEGGNGEMAVEEIIEEKNETAGEAEEVMQTGEEGGENVEPVQAGEEEAEIPQSGEKIETEKAESIEQRSEIENEKGGDVLFYGGAVFVIIIIAVLGYACILKKMF
ncbi:MAG: hypothetical protein ABIH83_02635 [Candidatus Micrarchaeota archaeon]